MSGLRIILGPTALLATASAVFVIGWSAMSWWLVRVERRLTARTGLDRDFVTERPLRDHDRLQQRLWWGLRGQFDAWRGTCGWERFARSGFPTGEHAGA